MKNLGRAAFSLLFFAAAPAVAQTPSAQGFPYGRWGASAAECEGFAKGHVSQAIEITEKEVRFRPSEEKLQGTEIVSMKKLDSGHFKMGERPSKNSADILWSELWTDDNGASLLVKPQSDDPTDPPRKYLACKEKQAPVTGNFGKWKVDLNPDNPRAVLDGVPNFPKVEVVCSARDALGYKFMMQDGRPPRFITMPGASGDTNLDVDPSGFMPSKNAARFVGAIADLLKQAKIDGSRLPESAFVTSIGVNGRIPDIVSIGGLMAVREALRPMCATATVFAAAPPPAAQAPQPSAAPLVAPPASSAQSVSTIQRDRFNKECPTYMDSRHCRCVDYNVTELAEKSGVKQYSQLSEFFYDVMNTKASIVLSGGVRDPMFVQSVSAKYPITYTIGQSTTSVLVQQMFTLINICEN